MTSIEYLNFSRNSYQSALQEAMKMLRTTGLYTDATIICKGKFFPVHKLALVTASDYFQQMFSQLSNTQNPVIILNEMTIDDLESLLDFIYLGEATISQAKAPQFLHIAKSFKVKDVQNIDHPHFVPKPKISKRKRKRTLITNTSNKRAKGFPVQNSTTVLSEAESSSVETQHLPAVTNCTLIDKEIRDESIKEEKNTSSDENNDATGKEHNDPISIKDIAGKEHNDAKKIEDTTGKEHNDVISIEDTTGKEHNDAISSEDTTGKEHNDASSYAECDAIMKEELDTSLLELEISCDDRLLLHSEDDEEYLHEDILSKINIDNLSPCPICSKTFARRYLMRLHMKIHTGEKPFSCDFCPFKTKRRNNLKRHVRRQHQRGMAKIVIIDH